MIILRRWNRKLGNYTQILQIANLVVFILILLYVGLHYHNWKTHGTLRQYQWNNDLAVMEFCYEVGDCETMPDYLRRQSISLYYQRVCPILDGAHIQPDFTIVPGEPVEPELQQFMNDKEETFE